jgi:hypothetical protein
MDALTSTRCGGGGGGGGPPLVARGRGRDGDRRRRPRGKGNILQPHDAFLCLVWHNLRRDARESEIFGIFPNFLVLIFISFFFKYFFGITRKKKLCNALQRVNVFFLVILGAEK